MLCGCHTGNRIELSDSRAVGSHPRGELAAADDLIEERQGQLLADARQMVHVLYVAC